jgi:hypothetical protein
VPGTKVEQEIVAIDKLTSVDLFHGLQDFPLFRCRKVDRRGGYGVWVFIDQGLRGLQGPRCTTPSVLNLPI